MDRWPLGVFASIDAGLGVKLEVAHELGIPTVQLHAPEKENRTAERAEAFLARLSELNIALSCVFGGFEGESYADIPTTQKTVGLVPAATRSARVAEMKEISDYARVLNCNTVGLHVGFIPHDTASAEYKSLVETMRDLLDHVAANGQNLHLETGQETAEGLLQFISDVARDNLFVNFDPANMILYGTGQPLEALERVGFFVKSVHCKDGVWSKTPGVTWGQETALGEGDVDFEAFLRLLLRLGYSGPLTIEREIPQEPERQKAEIGKAVALLQDLKSRIL